MKRKFGLSFNSFVRHVAGRGLAVLLVATSFATAAAAQEFRSDPVDEKARAYGGRMRAWLGNPAEYTANKANFAEYFQKYYFPDMTRTGADDLASLGDSRYNLFNRILWATTNEDLQRDLTNIAFAAMGNIVTADPPYHPAVRYNAILIIGSLDDQYAIEGRRPPKPMAKATKALTTIVDRATTSNQFPPPVILGALIGLERHAQYREGMSPDALDAMTPALLKLVTHEEPIQELDPEAYAWLRLRAASALAQLGSVGQNNAVHVAFIKLIAEFKSLDDRCATAALLAKLKYEGAKVDGAATAETLLKLARDVGAAESKRAQDFENASADGGGLGYGRREFGPAGAFGGQDTFPRRHVLARLTDLRTGLRTIKEIVPEDAQKKIDAVVKAIDPVRTAAANKDTVDLRLTEAIHVMAAAIDEAAAPAEELAAKEADTLDLGPTPEK